MINHLRVKMAAIICVACLLSGNRVFAASDEKKFTLSIDIAGVEKGDTLRFFKVFLPDWTEEPAFDIIVRHDGKFEYRGTQPHSQLYLMRYCPIKGKVAASDRSGNLILITSGEISLTGERDHIYYLALKGGVYDSQLQKIMYKDDSLGRGRGDLARQINEANAKKDTVAALEFISKFNNYYKLNASEYAKLNDLKKRYYSTIGSEYLACQLAQSSYKPLDELKNWFDKLTTESKESYYGKLVSSLIKGMEEVEPGRIAPDMELITTTGRAIKISDFRGKYLLIFHYGMCPGSFQTNPIATELYRSHSDSLDVIGITASIKTLQDSYDKAENDDKILDMNLKEGIGGMLNHPWKHDIDLSNSPESNKIIMQKYYIQGLPFFIFISPDGVILSRSIGDKALNMAKELLETKK